MARPVVLTSPDRLYPTSCGRVLSDHSLGCALRSTADSPACSTAWLLQCSPQRQPGRALGAGRPCQTLRERTPQHSWRMHAKRSTPTSLRRTRGAQPGRQPHHHLAAPASLLSHAGCHKRRKGGAATALAGCPHPAAPHFLPSAVFTCTGMPFVRALRGRAGSHQRSADAHHLQLPPLGGGLAQRRGLVALVDALGQLLRVLVQRLGPLAAGGPDQGAYTTAGQLRAGRGRSRPSGAPAAAHPSSA